ncbi:MAG: hypothetical protein H6718_32220 [Polyangiaceae bacterium]|nr:hypothetical protein [Myxococcales bacterium]MCB9590125.1 hypothetical protein [Polyangiaceae bacterium]MCB9608004.1 hypothetical protein [Polyangiaceae bacterium]
MRTWLILGACLGLAACDTNSSEVGGVNDKVGNQGGTGGQAGSGGTAGSGATGGTAGSAGNGGNAGSSGSGGSLGCDTVADEFRAFAAANNHCTTRDDCFDATPECLAMDQCEQNLTSQDIDRDQLQDYANRMQACATWTCGACAVQWAEPDCVNNQCVPGTLNQECGGPAQVQCNAGQYCDKPDGADCGPGPCFGTCKLSPEGCVTAECLGVCGDDGKVYCNACEAHKAGVDDVAGDSCNLNGKGIGDTCQTDPECQGGLKCCYPCGIAGCDNQCMVPDESGECPLFP